ncbi:MAG: glycoside hydrolase family 2 TIM barrel-domain containing protein [Acidobacteriota bacterium]
MFRIACMLAAACITCAGQTKSATPGAREIVTISSGWRFQIDVTRLGEQESWYRNDFDRSAWSGVAVPKAWDLFDEALWGYEGVGWYSTTLPAALARKDKVQRLKFGRVNYHTKAWLNGELLGENDIGYMPFEFDVTGKLRSDGANHLVLLVDNKARLSWLPGAKQIEWIQYGGILEPVTLESSAKTYISHLAINAVPEGQGASIACAVEITSSETAGRDVVLRVGVAGRPQSAKSVKLRAAPGKTVETVALTLPQANPWSPETPSLYRLTAALDSGGTIDTVSSRFGVRKIETRGREILLNGRRFRARGVNRYDEYGKYGPAPPRELLIADLRRMKDAGVNFVRVHYPQSPEILSLYDEMGFVMSEEVVLNWWGNNFSGKGEEVQSEDILRQQAMPLLERMIRRDRNHPCVIIWSMCNESQTSNEVGISVMRKLLRRAKELDPTRLATFVISPQEAKAHRAYEDADLLAVNVYHGQFGPNTASHIGQFEELVTRPSEAYIRRQLDAFPGKPVLITEFGTRGVPGLRGDAPYTEDFQAAFIKAVWKAITNCEEASGGVLWSWADYYHRRELIQYAVFGPYGVVTVDRRPKAALKSLAAMYGGKVLEAGR